MNTKEKNFEKELPEGYDPVYHIDAKNTKVGVIMNVVALGIFAVVMVFACLCVNLSSVKEKMLDKPSTMLGYTIALGVGILVYTALHELVHGVAYKALTGQKLTFGISWSCAFCGVPNVYVYKKTALIALIMPFAVFTTLFLAAMFALVFAQPLAFLTVSALFGLHFGGCCGDLYLFSLLCFKYKDKNLLIRDTGPEQFIYIKA